MGRFLDGVEDPEARVVRGARVAAIGFITGGMSAIPVNFLLHGFNPLGHLLEVVVLALGIACLRIDWRRRDPKLLYLIAIVATLVVATASITSHYGFAMNYVFIVLAVAVAAPFGIMLGAVAGISIALFVPAAIGVDTGTATLAFALVGAPALAVMGLIAHELTRKLERSREALWALAREDELTGINNYRALLEKLAIEISRHGRRRRNMSVLLLDLDQFKSVNDNHGHLEGDRVLKAVAGAIEISIRVEDCAFRQGGDEFAIIAAETRTEDLEPIITRLRENIELYGPDDAELTISVGVAMFPDDGTTPEELLSVADERLLKAKRGETGEFGSTERASAR